MALILITVIATWPSHGLPTSVSFPECLGVMDTSKAGVEKGCIWGGGSRLEEGEEHYLKRGIGLGFTLNVPSEKTVFEVLYSSEIYLCSLFVKYCNKVIQINRGYS